MIIDVIAKELEHLILLVNRDMVEKQLKNPDGSTPFESELIKKMLPVLEAS
jgi:hypothetical protein